MTDRELLDALTEFARRVGLLGDGVRFVYEQVPATEEQALCLAVGERKGLRLLCNYARGHVNMATGEVVHSWTNAPVGMSPCVDNRGPSANAPLCELPTHHTGEHKATAPDGVRWTWGDTRCPATHPDGVTRCHDNAGHSAMEHGGTGPHGPKTWARNVAAPEETGEPGTVCGAQEWGTNGHRMNCVLRAGHEGAHRGVDADGKSMVTWPCPCYPDCTGHAVDWSTVQLHTDSPEIRCGARNASQNPVMAGQVCELLRGHEGSHEATVNGQRWVFSATDPTEPRAS